MAIRRRAIAGSTRKRELTQAFASIDASNEALGFGDIVWSVQDAVGVEKHSIRPAMIAGKIYHGQDVHAYVCWNMTSQKASGKYAGSIILARSDVKYYAEDSLRNGSLLLSHNTLYLPNHVGYSVNSFRKAASVKPEMWVELLARRAHSLIYSTNTSCRMPRGFDDSFQGGQYVYEGFSFRKIPASAVRVGGAPIDVADGRLMRRRMPENCPDFITQDVVDAIGEYVVNHIERSGWAYSQLPKPSEWDLDIAHSRYPVWDRQAATRTPAPPEHSL